MRTVGSALLCLQLAVGMLAVGCGTQVAPALDVSGTWWAVELDGELIEIGRNTAEMPWFEITASTIGGNLGCNNGGGDYDLQGDRLVVSQLESESELCGIPDGSEVMVPTERFLYEMLTTGAAVTVDDETMTWTGAGHTVAFVSGDGEPPPPTTAPRQEFDRLRCAPGVVVESRHSADGRSPEDLAAELAPSAVRIEEDGPLRWWGYDGQGQVVVGIFLGDVPDPDYQVVTCGEG